MLLQIKSISAWRENYKHIGLFSVRHHWIMDYPPPMASFLTPPQFLACKIFDLWEVNQNLRDLDQNLWDFDRSFRDLDQILRFEPTSVRFGSMSLRFRSKSLIYGRFATPPRFAKIPPLDVIGGFWLKKVIFDVDNVEVI